MNRHTARMLLIALAARRDRAREQAQAAAAMRRAPTLASRDEIAAVLSRG